jgi:hypothetical protein
MYANTVFAALYIPHTRHVISIKNVTPRIHLHDMSNLQAYTLITSAAAATSGSRAMLIELLGDASIDVDADMPTIGGTALIAACRSKNVDVVRLLLERGADPNKFSKAASSNEPWEPLVSAVSHAPVGSDLASKLVALLLAHGATPTAHALKIAALHGCHDALRLMLLAGPPTDLTPDDASELLRYAASSTSIETIVVVNAHLRREAPSPGQPRPALQRLCDEEAEHEKSAAEREENDMDWALPSYGHICALAKADDPTVPAFRTRSELVRLILDLQLQVRQASSC